ncbi:hypothetical protein BW723_04870 [Polaribacter reichenbachii]|uniref:Uncharacterized protein n=1 Tax=Polaribacter reichenbachii TaxID=996801 RepID=A0A1B8TUU5_9FLAO|nr:hypothetical protein [Polaribacter reichenbachii]APZ45670.1 hypothetical protein BW723_04870 [Polaribacter reichenbachii]AUC19532.1 hypothetical protein BTO17_12880 [Polaribacter reichenbachii]OBY63314.1 hypothetical protein LPB301_10840 [Polaribacter reichenbachii]
MKIDFYTHRKKFLVFGILSLISGVLLAFLKWGIEPEETIAGTLCGVGLPIIIISLSSKK